MDFPAVGFRIGQRGLRRPIVRCRPFDLTVEADAERLKIQGRPVLRARGEANVGPAELAVEIFELDAPVWGEGVFDAGAGGPAEPDVDVLFFVADDGRVDEALAGPGQTTGGIGQPMSVGVADAAARGADIIPLLADVGARTRKRGHHRIRRQKIRKRHIGFDAEQHAGRQSNIVAGLHAADHAAEKVAGRAGRRIRQRGDR